MLRLRPRTFLERVSAGEFWFEVVLALAGIGYGILQTIRLWHDEEQTLATSHATIAFVLGGMLICRAFIRNRKALADDNAHALDGVLHALYAILHHRTNAAQKASLRICVFVPAAKPEMVHQITNYVGDSKPGGAGREIPLRAGVVGKAFRTGEAQFDKLPRDTEMIDYLVQAHGFDRGEAASLRKGRQSWSAVPVGEPGNVVAVIYLDSDTKDFFGNTKGIPRQILESATIGVAQYVEQS